MNKINKLIFAIAIFSLLAILVPQHTVFAAKARVRTAAPVARKAATAPVTGGFSSARLSRGTNSVILTLSNLSNIKRVNYSLSYTSNGKDEGIGGSINISGQGSESRDLYFGTCSSGVCTPHRYVTNAVLTVTATYNSGKTATKRYKIRV